MKKIMDAILEALEKEQLSRLHDLLRQPPAFERLVKEEYLREGAAEELKPDTEESQEAASVDEKRMERAAWTWGSLTESERQIVRTITDKICGADQGEELAYDLDIRLQQ
jgi:hypothetical protein